VPGLSLLFRSLVSAPARRHPLRVVLPAVGVAIGVAAVAAIYHANRSVTESFRQAAASVSGRSDFVVRGVRGVPVEALRSLSFLWGRGSFAPAVTGTVVAADGSGEIVELLGIDPGGDAAVREMKVAGAEGVPRTRLLAEDSVFVPTTFALRHHLRAGSRLAVVAGGVRREVRIAALLELTGVARASAGDLLVTDLFTAQRLLGREGFVDRVDVVLDPGVDREAARREIVARLPAGLRLEPPDRSAATADRMVRAFRFNLNALGSLTLLVGMFLVANAVSISVLRRRPEIAALRAVGASRASIFAVFLAEGLLVGAAGTLAGEVGGVFLSRAALGAVRSTVSDVYLPTARIWAAGYARPAILAGVAGLAAALVATLWPAAEATRVAPSAALRTGSIERVRRRRSGPRAIAAVALLAAAAAASRAGPVGGFPYFGFASVALVVAAIALASPILVVGFSRLAARPIAGVFGAPGRLATRLFGGALARNGLAVTALALALGMTLAMIVTVSSIRETVRVWVESTLRSDLWVHAASGTSRGLVGDLPPDVIPFLAGVPGVAALDPFRARDSVDDRGRPFTIASGDFRVVARLGGLPFLDGQNARQAALQARARAEALVSEPYSRRFGARRGSLVALPTPKGVRTFRVAGVYRDYSNDKGTILIDRELYLRLFDDPRVTSVAVIASPGVDPGELRRHVLSAAEGRFALAISTNRELRRSVLAIFDQTFAVTRSLEGIAIVVAILGVANALVASAVERRRSFGLLRAIGAAGRQIVAAVLLEAGLAAALATAVAVAAGSVFAWLLLAVINPQSFGWTVVPSVPIGPLTAAVGLVFAASIAAGWWPGRLAAAVDPADALAEE
jgi:putative ABC transport system permease protein